MAIFQGGVIRFDCFTFFKKQECIAAFHIIAKTSHQPLYGSAPWQ
jgi:hypothetical protein